MKLSVYGTGAGNAALCGESVCEGIHAGPCRAVKCNERVFSKDVPDPALEIDLGPKEVQKELLDIGVHRLEVIGCDSCVQRHLPFSAKAFVVKRCRRNQEFGLHRRSFPAAVNAVYGGIEGELCVRLYLFENSYIVPVFPDNVPKRALLYAGVNVKVVCSLPGRYTAFGIQVKGAYIQPKAAQDHLKGVVCALRKIPVQGYAYGHFKPAETPRCQPGLRLGVKLQMAFFPFGP